MIESQNNSALQEIPQNNEIGLLDLLFALAHNKAMILKVTLSAAILALGYVLTMPNIYTASTKILQPRQSQSSAGAMLGQIKGLTGLAENSLGIRNPSDLHIAILKSRTLLGKIAKRFDLQQVYKKETLTETLNMLGNNSTFTSGKDGVVLVEVSDVDANRAADIANAFIDELNTLMQTEALTEASIKRIFFEQQLRNAKDKLSDAEIRLDKTPNTSLKYPDAVRNMKYQGALWEILARQFEMSKLDEAKNFTLIQVLDKATPPEENSKPRRSLIVVLAALLAFFLAASWAFLKEYMLHDKHHPDQARRWKELRKAFFNR